MANYILRRLALLPVTLFFIILVNFAILSMAPGDPVSFTQVTEEGASKKTDSAISRPSENRYLQFREFYGLTLPPLLNFWPYLSREEVLNTLTTLAQPSPENIKEMDDLRLLLGDQSRFVMPQLLSIIEDNQIPEEIRSLALRFFVRGAYRLGYVGNKLSDEKKAYNKRIVKDTQDLSTLTLDSTKIRAWYDSNKDFYQFEESKSQKLYDVFFETRFSRYFSRVITLDFGVMRNDPNKTVIEEVVKRFKYSLTLSVIPLIITFFLSLFFGMLMAVYKNRFFDWGPNFLFLILFAIPIFVVAPFLIENAMGRNFWFTDTPIPTSGFTSNESIYSQETTLEKLKDILQHILLPMLAILYGSLAVQARLSRTAFLETMKKDYVRTAFVKGVGKFSILTKHVGRNAAITIITSVAGSLGVILGGSLIVETLFEIDGFGRFFYEAILNRDYNVIMFSALAGSFLTLMGYLLGDIAYMVLDPRVRLD